MVYNTFIKFQFSTQFFSISLNFVGGKNFNIEITWNETKIGEIAQTMWHVDNAPNIFFELFRYLFAHFCVITKKKNTSHFMSDIESAQVLLPTAWQLTMWIVRAYDGYVVKKWRDIV